MSTANRNVSKLQVWITVVIVNIKCVLQNYDDVVIESMLAWWHSGASTTVCTLLVFIETSSYFSYFFLTCLPKSCCLNIILFFLYFNALHVNWHTNAVMRLALCHYYGVCWGCEMSIIPHFGSALTNKYFVQKYATGNTPIKYFILLNLAPHTKTFSSGLLFSLLFCCVYGNIKKDDALYVDIVNQFLMYPYMDTLHWSSQLTHLSLLWCLGA